MTDQATDTAQVAPAPLDRTAMAARVARDIPEGWYVNLGIGVPTLVADHVPADREVIFHSENGILGFGPSPADPAARDPWIINAGKQHVTLRTGSALFHHADSFAIVRGGHLDLCVLGAFEVAENGDFANWTVNANSAPAVGGAMDLAVGAKRIWVVMEHVTKDGAPRLVTHCSYPLTARGAVTRVYTNLAVMDVTADGFVVRDMIPGMTFEALQEVTGAKLSRPA